MTFKPGQRIVRANSPQKRGTVIKGPMKLFRWNGKHRGEVKGSAKKYYTVDFGRTVAINVHADSIKPYVRPAFHRRAHYRLTRYGRVYVPATIVQAA